MAIPERTPEEVLAYAKEVRNECDTTPIGITITLVQLAELCVKQQREINRLYAYNGVRL